VLVVAAVWYTLVGASLGVVIIVAAASAEFRTWAELPDVCCIAVVNYDVEGIDVGRVTYRSSDCEEIVVVTVVLLGVVPAAGAILDGVCYIPYLVSNVRSETLCFARDLSSGLYFPVWVRALVVVVQPTGRCMGGLKSLF
jgi:hypothetical protein